MERGRYEESLRVIREEHESQGGCSTAGYSCLKRAVWASQTNCQLMRYPNMMSLQMHVTWARTMRAIPRMIFLASADLSEFPPRIELPPTSTMPIKQSSNPR